MTLLGFPGAGQYTLPWVLSQVANTWEVYGHGDNVPASVIERLKNEGAAYITATLQRFGMLRNAFLSSKNPLAAKYETRAPDTAVRAFDRHVKLLEGTMGIRRYIAYSGVASVAESVDQTTTKNRGKGSGKGDKKGSGRGGKSTTTPADGNKEWRLKTDKNECVLSLKGSDKPPSVYFVDKLNEAAAAGSGVCHRGLIGRARGHGIEAILCNKHDSGCQEHRFKAGHCLKDCRKFVFDKDAGSSSARDSKRKRKPSSAAGTSTGAVVEEVDEEEDFTRQ